MEHTSLFQVRYDECAADSARSSTLLRYTIETAFAHSTSKGFPLAWYDAHGLYWLVRSAYVDLFEDALAASGAATQQYPTVFELEFLRQSVPGDTLSRSLWRRDGAWMMELMTLHGDPISRGRRVGPTTGQENVGRRG